MALSRIVDELMNSEEACVVYSNDGSSLSGVGKFIVQSLTINGTPRSLPILGIFSESRESLSELVKCSLEMLAASSSYKFSAADIQKRIKFVMTDSTAHNMKIMEQVSKDLDIEETPTTVICNIHPLMMFQAEIKELCQQNHDSFGKTKLNDCFLVDVDYRNESFIIKAIKCLSNLINSDNSSKPWNRHNHFSEFIAPKKNMSLCLKDHRFNCLQDCSLSLLYHFDDIVNYLEKNKNVVNGLTVLDRSFAEMEILKPILATISLFGVHITRPFQNLIMDPSTNYSMLIKTFKQLYFNLKTQPSAELLQVKYTCNFIKEDMFTASLPATCLVENLNAVAAKYRDQVCSLLELALPSFADGFAYQRGAIFGFGPTANHETGSVLKVASADKSMLEQMDHFVPVHNILEERNVGSIGYELNIRGLKNISNASRKHVLNRSQDLLYGDRGFHKFIKEAASIKDIKLVWTEKMRDLQTAGYAANDLLNLKKQNALNQDLNFLKTCGGPFTSKQEISAYIQGKVDEATKTKRLYIEVRYARTILFIYFKCSFTFLISFGV